MPNRLDETLTPDVLARMDAYWRAANYPAVGHTCLNLVTKKYDLDTIYVSGPGHGGPDGLDLFDRLVDMTVLNNLDRFHLVVHLIDRDPRAGFKGVCPEQVLMDKLIEHRQYICQHGQELPEIRNLTWGGREAAVGSGSGA
jgi:phosphoketolase